MVDILHRIGITSSSPDDVYAALTTLEGLSGWWARDTTGETEVGGVIAFRFGPGGFDMKVVELVPGKRVLWEVVDGPAEWIGTHVSFELRQEGDFTIVLFEHHVPLQHQVGHVPAQPQAAAGDRARCPGSDRREDQRLALSGRTGWRVN